MSTRKGYWVRTVSKLDNGMYSVANFVTQGEAIWESIYHLVDCDGEWAVRNSLTQVCIKRRDIITSVNVPEDTVISLPDNVLLLAKRLMTESLPAKPSDYKLLTMFKATEGLVSREEWMVLQTNWYNEEFNKECEASKIPPVTEPFNPVALKIAEIRKDNGLSQEKLAEKAGITQGKLSRIESGVSEISCSDLISIAKALNRPASWFFERYTLEPDTVIWIRNDQGTRYNEYRVVGMGLLDDFYRAVFVAPVQHSRYLEISESGAESSYTDGALDYSRLQAVPFSGLQKAKGRNGYILNIVNVQSRD